MDQASRTLVANRLTELANLARNTSFQELPAIGRDVEYKIDAILGSRQILVLEGLVLMLHSSFAKTIFVDSDGISGALPSEEPDLSLGFELLQSIGVNPYAALNGNPNISRELDAFARTSLFEISMILASSENNKVGHLLIHLYKRLIFVDERRRRAIFDGVGTN